MSDGLRKISYKASRSLEVSPLLAQLCPEFLSGTLLDV